jgi:importin-5
MAVKEKHSRVRFAAYNCLAQLATDFRGEFQERFHEQVMPLYLNGLDLRNPPRLVRHALLGLIDFAAWADSDQIVPYLDATVPLLVNVLKQRNSHVRARARTERPPPTPFSFLNLSDFPACCC